MDLLELSKKEEGIVAHWVHLVHYYYILVLYIITINMITQLLFFNC